MRNAPSRLTAAALLLAASLSACPDAHGQGWQGASQDRYGSATTQPAAGAAAQPLGSSLNTPARQLQPLSTSGAAPLNSSALGNASSLSNTSSLNSSSLNSSALSSTPSALTAQPSGGMAPTSTGAPSRVSATTKPTNGLPNQQGQVWVDYDIRPYTLRINNQQHPEQTIVDWILRETGYEAWHSEPFGFLNANRDTLSVYHTPEMQAVVLDILNRFASSQAAGHAFSLRIATVQNPNWRAKALPLMSPIPVQSPGMQGWIMPKENAAVLLSQLTARGDWREHSASNQMVLNGHKVLLSTMRPRKYIKGVIRTDNTWPGFQPETGQLEEGATMEFSPLLSNDMSAAEAVIKIRIHQVEKMAKVKLDIPTTVTGNQRMEVEVPQMTMANVHERFRWPADQVLVLSMGVIPPPTQTGGNRLMGMLPGVNSSPRADGLLMIEVRGTAIPGATPAVPGARTALQPGAFSGRY